MSLLHVLVFPEVIAGILILAVCVYKEIKPEL